MEMKFRAFRPKNGHTSPENETAQESEMVRRGPETPRQRLRKYVVEERPNGPGKFPIKRRLGICYGNKDLILETEITPRHPGVSVAVRYEDPELCNENGRHGEEFSVSVLTIYERVAFMRAGKMLPDLREWIRVLLQPFHGQDLSDVS